MEQPFAGSGRFEVLSRLGSGGMGVVYKVYDRETESYVALKTLRIASADALLRFKNEFRAMHEVRHPNVVRLGELAEIDGTWFYTMELVPGDDFIQYVFEDHVRLRAVLAQLARGLDALHSAHMIHRDVKPSNIKVTEEGRAVLLDFGLVLDEAELDTLSESVVVGTGSYIAPEQITPRNASSASDCYAVGVMMYEALTGGVPFEGTAVEMLLQKQKVVPKPPSATGEDVPEDLDQLCMELLAIDPTGRPTAAQILDRVGQRQDNEGASGRRRRRETGEVSAGVFVGRARELQQLLDAARRPREAHTIIIRGPSGVGKTSLVGEFIRLAREENSETVVLNGRCYERETVPFKGIDGVVDRLTHHMRKLSKAEAAALLPRQAGLLAQVFPVLRRVDVIGESPRPRGGEADPQELRRRAFAALRELFARFSIRCPLVIAIDDLQWADGDSLALLADLLEPPEAPPLLLVLTSRPPRADERDVAAVLHGRVETMELGGLPPDEARILAERLLAQAGAQVTPEQLAELAREAGGLPLFIHELVQHVALGGGEARIARLEDALFGRFERLDPLARAVLEVVAISGSPIAQETAAVACEVEFRDLMEAVEELRADQLVHARGSRRSDSIECYHDRIREAVLASLDEERTRTLHHRMADALEATGVAERRPEMVLHHLRAAGQNSRAAYHAELAAERAFKGLAFDRAAALYRMALRMGSYEPEDARRLRSEQANALVHAGRGAAAAELYLEAVQGARPAVAHDFRRRAAEQLLRSGHVQRGLRVTEEVLAAVSEYIPTTRRGALASLLWQRVRLRARGYKWKEQDLSDIIPRDLMRLDVYRGVAVGLSAVDHLVGADFQTRHLRLALQLGVRSSVLRALAFETIYLAGNGSSRRARTVLAMVRDLVGESSEVQLQAWAKLAAAAIPYFVDNDWLVTNKLLLEVEQLNHSYQQAGSWETGAAQLYRVFCLTYMGSLDELATSVAAQIRDAEFRGDRYSVANMRTRAVLPELVAGRVDEAAAGIDSALEGWALAQDTFQVQHYYALHSRCEIALYRGEPARAAELMASELPLVRRALLLKVPIVDAEVLYLRGRIAVATAAAESSATERRRYVSEAKQLARVMSKHSMPLARVLAPLIAAGVSRLSGEDVRADEQLRGAVRQLEDTGNGLYAQAARRALGGTEAVTAREWAEHYGVSDWAALGSMLVAVGG